MATKKKPQTSFEVSTPGREVSDPLTVYLFDRRGELVERGTLIRGKATIAAERSEIAKGRLLLAPDVGDAPTLDRVEKAGGFEPFLGVRDIPNSIVVPPIIVDRWPLCLCIVRGQVVRPDGRAICDARVHVCEVDRVPLIIAKLPEPDLLRLRDDLLEVLLDPPMRVPTPQPDLSVRDPRVALPGLTSEAIPVVRRTLIDNHRLILPWLCLWPWWWGWFRCDEIRVLDTDQDGRFQAVFGYDCSDQPDLYFWVEFDLGTGFETVYKPTIACNTYWDYQCGTDVTITVSDPRVPACDDPPATGCDVNVLSIGRTVSIRELEDDAGGTAQEGLTQTGEPFGGKLEPRVDFDPALIDKGVPFFRWSYRRLSGPDGLSTSVDPASEPIGPWKILTRDVYRHYREATATGTSYPSYLLGPLPIADAPAPNLFRVRPALSPAGDAEWRVLDEREDLASGHFETTKLTGAPEDPGAVDLAAGRYELKLELFDTNGDLVNWTDLGIELGITDQNAPFGIATITTSPAPNYNRILDGTGKTIGFRMVIRVDNNRCLAEIHDVGGDVTSDPDCGFHTYDDDSDRVTLSFTASHPNGFATYDFDLVRGATTPVPAGSTSGTVGAGGNDGFSHLGGSMYSKEVSVATLTGACPSAAFAEALHVAATAQNGYSRLSGNDARAVAGFALTPSDD